MRTVETSWMNPSNGKRPASWDARPRRFSGATATEYGNNIDITFAGAASRF
jgi:hypothetical protein